MSEPTCRGLRELLGVYVVGAIEPAERALVDAHLNVCRDCREELAGLAPLPALMRRVTPDEAARIAYAAGEGPADWHGDDREASPEILDAMLARVRGRRQSRRVQSAFAIAAGVLIAAGAGAAVGTALSPQATAARHVAAQVAEIAGPVSVGTRSATVRYGTSPWGTGTTMSVQVTGFPQWTTCKFWVLTKNGREEKAGSWTVGPRGDQLWYPSAVGTPKSDIADFVITWGHQRLLIPA
jgi:hypothetical protein